jgi:hypothetical protein
MHAFKPTQLQAAQQQQQGRLLCSQTAAHCHYNLASYTSQQPFIHSTPQQKTHIAKPTAHDAQQSSLQCSIEQRLRKQTTQLFIKPASRLPGL